MRPHTPYTSQPNTIPRKLFNSPAHPYGLLKFAIYCAFVSSALYTYTRTLRRYIFQIHGFHYRFFKFLPSQNLSYVLTFFFKLLFHQFISYQSPCNYIIVQLNNALFAKYYFMLYCCLCFNITANFIYLLVCVKS